MRRPFPRAWKGAALSLLLIAAAPASAPVLREVAWTDPASDVALITTQRPGECLARTDALIETGRALFRSPQLLGGPAARVGLSCEACHTEGRVNVHFLLPELTDRPGMVDVTSEWASKVRGDGVANPAPIPDLVGVARKGTFGSHGERSLETFVKSVIVDEFQGHEPTPRAFEGLIAYLRALDPAACAPDGRLTLATAADEVRRALAAARVNAEAGDVETSRALRLAAQDAMARLAERLPAPAFNADRRRFEALSRELGAADVAGGFGPAWMARFDAAVARVQRRERWTYFNPEVLRAALIKSR
ncbi:MAG: hypothetical protein IV086_12905 [Hyphomonadaceae bacterium]|nr:MAG: hypothetical protein FD160_2240 [Caulobacteraceae bacterium]MBT9446594.1 hypothetical protein [Hyphomonadaceae bacterium]TPW02187.1 MAG: hypothetical protein FD124_3483 [Alphaproteobacteria bacterium]